MTNALDLSPAEWGEALRAMGQPAFRAGQVFSWLHKGAKFSEMGNLPKTLREALAAEYDDSGVTIFERFPSKLDGTVKYLYRLADGNLIEGVRMRYHYGDTLCVSTQVGCRMGCRFCASTLEGLARNLTAGEILGQIVAANAEGKITNVVLRTAGQLRQRRQISAPAARKGRRGNVAAVGFAFDVRAGAAHAPLRRGGAARNAQRFAARPERRHPQDDDARG